MNLNLPDYPSYAHLIPLGVVSFIAIFLVFLGMSAVFVKLVTDVTAVGEREKKKYKEASDALEEAQKHSFSIIKEAHDEARKVLEDANKLGKQMASAFDSRIEEVAEEQLEFLSESSENLTKVYRKAMLEASKGNLDSIHSLSGRFQEELEIEVKEFRENLSRAQQDSLNKIERELDTYKKSRLNEFDQEFDKALSKAMDKVFGKVLDVEDHEEYIVQVLEDAKSAGLFNS